MALALIPEAIAFSIIAGVDPKVGLCASFSIAVIIAFTGGRPGMISAATGAMALVMLLVKEHGLQYLLAATVLTRVLQIAAGALRLGSLMRFVSRSSHQAAVRALAFKWLRILYRCWQTRTPYDESTYLNALKKRGSPVLNQLNTQT